MNTLEKHTRGVRDSGRKLLVPYVTGGLTANWTDYLHAAADAGADVVEIGLPFSDPMLDGPAIQRASDTALARGATVDGILRDVARLDLRVPLVAMTYANLVFRRGAEWFCSALRDAGVAGLIVPDVPIDEVDELSAAATGLDLVLLVSPATPPGRRREIAGRSRGFVYAVSVMGTTGAREALPATAGELAQNVKAVTDLPVLLGFGVSSPAGARAAAARADGVIVASTLMQQVLEGASPADVGVRVAEMRAALDGPDD
ncbi:tryptophan synthase subunit alpha [Actinoplanes sp. NPDC051470]|uniref:tryptophan synthase subunit alpha n=1 Tax=Actinoplanes sp. NPDC051470 TaxID=3157224 RepID=UPI003419A766